MSRGFDGPEIDDFQGPERDVSRGPESNIRAGFQIYARRGEADRLRRIRDERELNTVIFSL